MIPADDKAAIGSAFDAAASRYDQAAALQRRVAGELATRIAALDLPERPTVLEIGCGTGFLGRALAPRLGEADFTCTDIAPAMAALARNRASAPARYAVMDGERPCFAPEPRFDLICSSLAVQWFATPAASFSTLAALLRPGGYLVFSTLGIETFREWRGLLEIQELRSGMPHYPDAAGWKSMLPGSGRSVVDDVRIAVSYPDAHRFLSDLKQIGAGTPRRDHRPLAPGELRRALRGIAVPFIATYHVVYATYHHGT